MIAFNVTNIYIAKHLQSKFSVSYIICIIHNFLTYNLKLFTNRSFSHSVVCTMSVLLILLLVPKLQVIAEQPGKEVYCVLSYWSGLSNTNDCITPCKVLACSVWDNYTSSFLSFVSQCKTVMCISFGLKQNLIYYVWTSSVLSLNYNIIELKLHNRVSDQYSDESIFGHLEKKNQIRFCFSFAPTSTSIYIWGDRSLWFL